VGEQMRVTAEDHAPSGLAFEGLAFEYDTRFTDGFIGRLLRNVVWRRLDVNFRPGSRILDLGCGTGEDAVYLADRVLVLSPRPASIQDEMILDWEHPRDPGDPRLISAVRELRAQLQLE